ncbi:glutamyl-tRNA synthetase/glutamyl-Q tRNA(Asp) synthetase [Neolewinella xylanilytica]|uniref:Glutamyl-tRNA synthetase/glutamyl-Q tRNA(Asp) synthetase n=1 Tax=Neolewinella xylanilytica TaxID=1514080 RepID=A0A2S6I9C3_9BACT|nr:glutamate--tRNA ligase family protein [Neolewinella xylanilytica]PPK88100.1 glutamyl-tRNA synthetase/glutamyl-Q tRNA(Asp) synthetase [Neolewinella xylanilytica]
MHRIAPTPSGYLHPGNAANFAANALLADGGPLLLRIDDLDRERFRPEYLEDVFEVLHWLGIDWTHGPKDATDFERHWSQEYRMTLYLEALEELRTRAPAQVFACPCSRKELADGVHVHGCLRGSIAFNRPAVAWRVDTRGTILHESMPWFAVRKKDGRPSYQLACTVDDLHFGITECARGEDLRDSTAAQALLSDLLGYPPLLERIRFVHHPLILEGGEKLSKSQGSRGVREWGVSAKEIFQIAENWLRVTPSNHPPCAPP